LFPWQVRGQPDVYSAELTRFLSSGQLAEVFHDHDARLFVVGLHEEKRLAIGRESQPPAEGFVHSQDRSDFLAGKFKEIHELA